MAFQLAFGGVSTSALLQTAAETIKEPIDPLFRDDVASDSLLRGFPLTPSRCERKIWDWDKAQERLASASKVSFVLKTVENRDWRLAKSDAKKRAKGVDPLAPEPAPISEARASLSVSTSAPFLVTQASRGSVLSRGSLIETDENLTRADKLFQGMLKAEKARKEAWKREEWEDFLNRAAKAAEKAKIAQMNAEKKEEVGGHHDKSDSSESDRSEEEEDEEEEEDPGPLQPYPGVMKVEVEVVVLRAPGAEHSDTESTVDDDHKSVSEESDKSADDDDGTDWMKELQALNEELGEPEKVEVEDDTDSLPDGLAGSRIGNIHDNLDKRTALGLGGTAFFVPEVERYAFAPSLLPPPPRTEGYLSLTGMKRLKIKPRLPLEVSRHRWRDEHPYGCPVEPGFSPSIDDYRELEEKVRRVELYGTISNWCHTMVRPDGLRKLPKQDDFEEKLDRELQDSVAWQQYIKRTRLLEVARSKRDGKEDTTKVQMAAPPPEKPSKPEDPVAALLEKEKAKVEKKEKKEKPKVLQPIKVKKRPVTLPPHPGPPPLKLLGQPHEPSWQVGQVIKPKPKETKVNKKTKKPKTLEIEEPEANFSRKYSPEVPMLPRRGSPVPVPPRRGSFVGGAGGTGGDANLAALAAFAAG